MLRLALQYLPLPKVIAPKQHKVFDYLTIGAFLITGAIWWKKHRKAAAASFANGLFLLSYTPLTDFDGDGKKPIPFLAHSKLDRIHAASTAFAPGIFGFGGDKPASFFHAQALNETFVISLTRSKTHRANRKLRRAA